MQETNKVKLFWKNSDIPHKGWTLVNVQDVFPNWFSCQMCGNEQIRYVHKMSHPNSSSLKVGCICAEKMSDDYVNPRRLERKLRNKLARRNNWLKKDWKRSSKGNLYLKSKGVVISIFPNKFREGEYKFSVAGSFSKESFANIDRAKMGAFNTFDSLLI